MYLHSQLVPEGYGKRSSSLGLAALKKQLSEMCELVPTNDVIRSSRVF